MALSRLKALVATQAVRKFTDRESAKDAFARNLREHLAGRSSLRVLGYYGVGGIGKTSLLCELRQLAKGIEESAPAGLSTICLDFDSDNIGSAADALYAFRLKWPGKCPLFEFALAQYWAAQGRSLEQIRRNAIPDDSLLFDLVEAGSSLVDVFAPAKLLKKVYERSADFLRRYGDLSDRFARIEALPDSALAEWLPALLGEEVEQWALASGKRLLVFVDGHERLSSDERFKLGKLVGDEWLRELIGAAGNGLYVICGRNYLDWVDVNAEWSAFLEQHVLGELSVDDAQAFLLGIPIEDGRIRDWIVSAAHGVPLYLDLCASIYLLKRQSGCELSERDFDGAGGRVIDRFLSCLDREQAEAVRALSGVELFDKRLFGEIAKALNIGIPVTLFEEFCAASYAEFAQRPVAIAKIHDIVRAYLRPTIATDDLGRIAAVVLSEAESSRRGGEYDRSAWLVRGLLPSLKSGRDVLGDDGQATLFDLCLELADAGHLAEAQAMGEELAAAPDDHGLATIGRLLRAHCSRRASRLEEARELYASICGETLSRLAPELRLRVRYHAAHVRHLLGDYAFAREAYREIVNDGEAHSFGAGERARPLAKRQLGDLLMLEGRFVEARRMFEECLDSRIADRLWQMECLRLLGHVYRFNCMFREAERCYSSVAEASKLGNARGMYGKALVNLAETCWCTEPERALRTGEEAIEACDSAGNQIEVGKALSALSLAAACRGELPRAHEYLLRSEAIQNATGYRSGLVFVEYARACLCFASGEDEGLAASLESIEAQVQSLGSYAFLSRVLRVVCGVDALAPVVLAYDWLDVSRLEAGVARLSGTLQHARRTAR